MRKLCRECGKRPVKERLYAFCSQRCAARWAVFAISDGENELAEVWCRRHGWVSATNGCYDCEEELCRRCGHTRSRHVDHYIFTDDNEGCQEDDCECRSFVGPKRGTE